jgi:hypothetical protein
MVVGDMRLAYMAGLAPLPPCLGQSRCRVRGTVRGESTFGQIGTLCVRIRQSCLVVSFLDGDNLVYCCVLSCVVLCFVPQCVRPPFPLDGARLPTWPSCVLRLGLRPQALSRLSFTGGSFRGMMGGMPCVAVCSR